MNSKKTLVIGDIMLDHYMYCNCERISPEAPVPVVALKNQEWLLGGAANVANNLIALGIEVILCGVVGNDENGAIFSKILKEKNIQNLLCLSPKRKTTVKSRVLSGGYQLLRIDTEDIHPVSEAEEKEMILNIELILKNCNCILISDYNKGVLSINFLEKIMKLATQYELPVLVDPKSPPFLKYAGSNIIKPNKKEAFLETGIELINYESIKNACIQIKKNTGISIIVITLSEDGVAVFENGKLDILPTKAKEVFDVTGAGDTFLAALAYSLVKNMSIIEACDFANYAAAIVVGKRGCATTNINEIEKLIIKDKYTYV